jgi:hypothetical protein
LISTLGGAEKKIADGGHNPKFSPDGASIAYWLGHPFIAARRMAALWSCPSAGANPAK